MKFNLLSISGLLILVGCGPTMTEADVAARVFGSNENLTAIKAATKATACRIELPADAHDGSASPDQLLAKYEEGEWIECSAPQVERLRDPLIAPRTYVDAAKSCFPRYGVRVRFTGQGKPIDVNLCFECNILAVVRDGQVVGCEDFDRGARELAAICKELFPDDAEIQALKP